MSSAPFPRKHLALPLSDQLIAFAWFVLFVAVGVLVLLADRGLVSSSLARLLRGNPDALAPKVFGALMIATGLGTLLRSRLGGVVIDEDRITTRTSTVLGLPRVHMAYFAALALLVLIGLAGWLAWRSHDRHGTYDFWNTLG